MLLSLWENSVWFAFCSIYGSAFIKNNVKKKLIRTKSFIDSMPFSFSPFLFSFLSIQKSLHFICYLTFVRSFSRSRSLSYFSFLLSPLCMLLGVGYTTYNNLQLLWMFFSSSLQFSTKKMIKKNYFHCCIYRKSSRNHIHFRQTEWKYFDGNSLCKSLSMLICVYSPRVFYLKIFLFIFYTLFWLLVCFFFAPFFGWLLFCFYSFISGFHFCFFGHFLNCHASCCTISLPWLFII